jgi:hypothetical protein
MTYLSELIAPKPTSLPLSLSLSLSLFSPLPSPPPLGPPPFLLPPFTPLCICWKPLSCHLFQKQNPKKNKKILLLWTHPPPEALWCFLISFLTNVCPACLVGHLLRHLLVCWVPCPDHHHTHSLPHFISHLLYPCFFFFFTTITFVSFVLNLGFTLLMHYHGPFSFLLCFHMIN